MDVNENATNQVIQELTAEKLRLIAENEQLRSALKEKKERESGGSTFARIIEENSVQRRK